jgi:hypothetical protein
VCELLAETIDAQINDSDIQLLVAQMANDQLYEDTVDSQLKIEIKVNYSKTHHFVCHQR